MRKAAKGRAREIIHHPVRPGFDLLSVAGPGVMGFKQHQCLHGGAGVDIAQRAAALCQHRRKPIMQGLKGGTIACSFVKAPQSE